MKHKLLTKLLFLTLLAWGEVIINPAWGDNVNVLSEDFSTNNTIAKLETAGWTFTGNKSYQSGWLQMASGSGAGSATTPAFTSLVGSSATLTFKLKSSGSNTNTLTITGVNCKVDGNSSTTKSAASSESNVTIEITEASTTSKITFSAVKSGGCRIDNVMVYYETSSDPSSAAAFAEATPSINFPATTTYLQAATTAEGYMGTISYEMTANTAGATINAATGLVTVTQGGSVTVKATAPAVAGFSSSYATYTLTVTDTRTSAGLAWSEASANVTYGSDSNVFPTLTNPHDVTVTYTSSNPSAATIGESGVITLNDVAASTYIRATFAGDDDYLPQTVSYILNVAKGPFAIKDGVFDFVEAADANEDYGSGISTTDNGQYYEPSDATWTAGSITMLTSGKYRWWYNGNTLRFYYNSDTSTASTFTLSAPTNYVITKVVLTGGSNFDVDSGELKDGTWTGVSNSVTFAYAGTSGSSNVSKIIVTYISETQTVNIGSAGFATFSAPYAVDFSATALNVYTAAVSGDKVVLTTVDSKQVPANTGVILEGTTSNGTVVASAAALDGNELLVSNGSVVGDGTKYALGVGKTGVNKDKVGFYLVGDGVTIPSGKAYLSVPSSIKEFLSFGFEDDDATGLNSLTPALSEGEGAIYNIAGQRISKMQKGINIVNGKKILK